MSVEAEQAAALVPSCVHHLAAHASPPPMASARFRVEDIPDLAGKVAIVTGGNGGIGLEIVRGHAR